MSFIFNSSQNNLNKMPVITFDNINQNHGRSFGPLLGLFLVNLLAKAVEAKYYSYFPFHLPYDSNPWLAYNKPQASYNHHNYLNQWHPIKNPYIYQNYPTLTTISPHISEQHILDYDNDYGNYDYTTNSQYQNYDKLIPAESANIYNKVISKINQENLTTPIITTILPVSTTTEKLVTTTTQELIPAESNYKIRRQPTQKYRRRPEPSRQKYPQRRRRPTTTLNPNYYDSYEDYYPDRHQPNKRRKPQYQSAEFYYDNSYYDSFESTTRYKKPKRKPTRRPIKNSNRNDESSEFETSTEKINPNTEIVIVRQAQTTTTAATTTATTTEPNTIITNTTASVSTTPNTNITYGYGPSNGNEYISFTYAPPSKYQIPYIDWYTQEATKNAIVKRVRDIINIDRRPNYE